MIRLHEYKSETCVYDKVKKNIWVFYFKLIYGYCYVKIIKNVIPTLSNKFIFIRLLSKWKKLNNSLFTTENNCKCTEFICR